MTGPGSSNHDQEAADRQIDEIRERLIEAEAARWRADAALEDVRSELDRAVAEYDALLGSRPYRYFVHPLQRVLDAVRRKARTPLPAPANRVSATAPAEQPSFVGDVIEDIPAGTPLRYHIYGPETGQEVEEDLVVTVAGWVVSEASPVACVEVWADGAYRGNARLGIAAPDAATELDRPDAYLSGFESLVDLTGLPRRGGAATLDIHVVTLDGARYRIFSVTVRLPGDGRLRSRLPAVAPHGNVRLLVVTHDLGLGGAQLYLFELLRLLSRSSDFSAVIVSHTDGALREPTEALGIPVVLTGAHPVSTEERYELCQQELEGWARDAGFNVVLANTLICFHGVDLASRLSLPAVWAIHDSLELPVFWRVAYGSVRAVDPRVRERAEAAFGSAAAVLFVADATRNLLSGHGDARRFVTVPYGIDFDEIDAFVASVSRADARRRLELPDDATVLICVGTIEPRKAQTILAQAFALAAAGRPDAILALVGARSDYYTKDLTRYVRAAGLSSRVRVISVTPDVYSWFRAADGFVSPSDVESLPRTVLEAMAFEVPVIATRIFGLPELIDDGVTGYLCEPRDLKALADALERFLSTSSTERAEVASAAARLVREKHDSRGYALAYDRLLRRLLEDPAVLPTEAMAQGAPASLGSTS